jgi:PIN domain nuclease of toxin-antitoxin system
MGQGLVMPLLLDTCAAIWIIDDAKLAQPGVDALKASRDTEEPIFVSPITSLEVGRLMATGRLASSLPPKAWFKTLLTGPRTQLAEMTPEMLIDASYLPGNPPNDPIDRILLATARDLSLTLLTRDRAILSYAEAGHVLAVRC